MAYDARAGNVVLFGGERAAYPFPYLRDTWVYQ
jgi:hypothetical protein